MTNCLMYIKGKTSELLALLVCSHMTMITETLIPFLLVTHLPINSYEVYYGSQYTFNLSNTMEYGFGTMTQHVNIGGKLECRNSGTQRLICCINNATKQYYEETQMNGTHPKYPRYIDFPSFNMRSSFEIAFKEGKIHNIFVNRPLNAWKKIQIIEISELLNLWWIDLNESEKGLTTVDDEKFERKKRHNCQSIVKQTKQKNKNYKRVKFNISSIGKNLNINSGMTLNFKRTQMNHRACLNSLYLFYKADNTQPKILNEPMFKAKSFYSRVILSENEFISFTENAFTYCPKLYNITQYNCNYSIHQKITLVLDSVNTPTTDLSIINSPINIYYIDEIV